MCLQASDGICVQFGGSTGGFAIGMRLLWVILRRRETKEIEGVAWCMRGNFTGGAQVQRGLGLQEAVSGREVQVEWRCMPWRSTFPWCMGIQTGFRLKEC